MQTVRLGSTIASVPESWRELNLKRYIKLTRWDRQDFTALCEALLDTPLVKSADPDSLQRLTRFLGWLHEPHDCKLSDLSDHITVRGKKIKYPLNIAKQPYQCKMYMQKHISDMIKTGKAAHDVLYEVMPFTLACYLYTGYSGKPFSLDEVNAFQDVTEQISMIDAVPLAQEYHRQNFILNRRWQSELAAEYDKEELSAGIRKFERFGNFGTTYNLAITLGMTREQVSNLPYNEVFLSLAMEKQKGIYRKKLHKILTKKS